MHVIVVGAGITGLLIAQGLKKHGISFSICEKAARGHRARNWGITLHWAHEHLDHLLPGDLRSRLIEGQVDRQQDADAMKGYEEIALRNGLTGEAFYKFPHTGIREYNVGRLKALLSEGLNIQYGRSFSHANFEGDTVTAVFEDGSSILGSVLIGTDGGSSMVRRFAVKSPKLAEAEVLPFNMVNLTTTFPAEQAILIRSKIHPVADIGMHPKGMYFRLNILDIVDPEKPETWEFQLLSTWPYSQGGRLDSPEKRFEMFKSLAKDWCDPHRSAVEWLPCSVKLHDDHLRDWITTSWYDHDGRLTMGGDALHAMTFHLGQGANNAVRDAAMFVDAMKQVQETSLSRKEAVLKYEAEVVERGIRASTLSRQQTFATHEWEKITTSLINSGGLRASLIK